jgi:hypothetical protein
VVHAVRACVRACVFLCLFVFVCVCVCGGAGSLYVQPGRSDQSGHEPA